MDPKLPGLKRKWDPQTFFYFKRVNLIHSEFLIYARRMIESNFSNFNSDQGIVMNSLWSETGELGWQKTMWFVGSISRNLHLGQAEADEAARIAAEEEAAAAAAAAAAAQEEEGGWVQMFHKCGSALLNVAGLTTKPVEWFLPGISGAMSWVMGELWRSGVETNPDEWPSKIQSADTNTEDAELQLQNCNPKRWKILGPMECQINIKHSQNWTNCCAVELITYMRKTHNL